MITEDYVSFETAKLLKEKGFDGSCFYVWTKTEDTVPSLLATANFVEGEMVTNRETLDAVAQYHMNIYGLNNRVEGYLCPSIAMAMKWLREVHKLHIEPHIQTYKNYSGKIYNLDGELLLEFTGESPEQACEAAIKYCLKYLI